jgi:transposase
MQVLYSCCCGLDIHKRFVVACILTTAADGRVQKVTRTFSTMTDDLLTLLDWLTEAGCTHIAMESTSAYWRPIYNLLEGHLTVLVANAAHVKASSADYPYGQHGLSRRDGGDHRPYPSALRPDPPAG